MPETITTTRSSNAEFVENPYDAEPRRKRTYDQNTLGERINHILTEYPDYANRAIESQSDFSILVQKIFHGRAGRWPTPQIQVELSRKLLESTTLHDFR